MKALALFLALVLSGCGMCTDGLYDCNDAADACLASASSLAESFDCIDVVRSCSLEATAQCGETSCLGPANARRWGCYSVALQNYEDNQDLKAKASDMRRCDYWHEVEEASCLGEDK